MRPRVDPKFLAGFLEANRVVTLNVAGSRESLATSIGALVAQALDKALTIS